MTIKSIRSFIGAKDFQVSRAFYLEIGFSEIKTSDKMSYFHMGTCGFYLQDYYVKDWIENSMLFLEVEDLKSIHELFKLKNLTEKYNHVKLSEIVINEWGNEFFLHDPSGILWHIGTFNN